VKLTTFIASIATAEVVRRRRWSPVALAAVALILAGCGVGAKGKGSGVSVLITRGFGSTRVAASTRARVPGGETVLRLLQRSLRVSTGDGGAFVESIDGLSRNSSRGWFPYVNGIKASQPAATLAVHGGDHIWWDLHEDSAARIVRAVVGSFPEPFAHGIGGKRYPTTLECAPDVSTACQRVAAALQAAGVPAASQLLGTGSGTDTLGVLVGTWRDLAGSVAASLIEKGPSLGGVYAHFAGSGTRLELLDPLGHVSRTLGAGAGLVAATADSTSSTPTWLITGTDAAGVSAAAGALTAERLRDHFALAIQHGTDYPLPWP
jgi:hypothetical protein